MGMITMQRVDNRVCNRCGARAGNCEHLKAEPYTVEVLYVNRNHNTEEAELRRKTKWTAEQRRDMRMMADNGLSYQMIANRIGNGASRSAVAGVLHRDKIT